MVQLTALNPFDNDTIDMKDPQIKMFNLFTSPDDRYKLHVSIYELTNDAQNFHFNFFEVIIADDKSYSFSTRAPIWPKFTPGFPRFAMYVFIQMTRCWTNSDERNLKSSRWRLRVDLIISLRLSCS